MVTAEPSKRDLALPAIAYLRALAEGVRSDVAASRYLRVNDAVGARRAHREVVDAVRALARRRGDPGWRLVGVELESATQRAAATPPDVPSLEEWADAEGLDGWSPEDLLETYRSRFGLPAEDAASARRQARAERLRVRRLKLLRQLERAAAAAPLPTDRLEGWIDPTLASRLAGAGLVTLEDVQRLTATGARWWRAIPAVGETKARAIEAQVVRLLGAVQPSPSGHSTHVVTVDWKRALDEPTADRTLVATGYGGANGHLPEPAIDARSDRAAIAAWVAARAGSELTRRQYTREGERFLLWARVERRRSLAGVTADDCGAYLTFLQNLPAEWISKRKVAPYSSGWAPFAGPQSQTSRRLTAKIVFSIFQWLTAARYLPFNPWTLVNRKLGDEARARTTRSRAFTPAAWATLLAELERPAPRGVTTASIERLRWICTMGEATGLRSAELLRATRGDVEVTRYGAVLHVLGKGQKLRQVALPKVALAVCGRYFESRGLDWTSAPAETPLLASLVDPMEPMSYPALHEAFKRFVRRALRNSDLPLDEQRQAEKASMHWLRHTHGTRFAERGGDVDVLQANLGHSDPRTAAIYYQAQLERRQKQLEKAFG